MDIEIKFVVNLSFLWIKYFTNLIKFLLLGFWFAPEVGYHQKFDTCQLGKSKTIKEPKYEDLNQTFFIVRKKKKISVRLVSL